MGLRDRLAEKVPALGLGSIDVFSHESLAKATYVELFFDLVFIFCMRSILPIITDAEGGAADWYTYYTFWFTFVLMLQIWFNSTIFMNRFGTGGVPDIVFLFTNMFLLFVMTQAIEVSWANYLIYNVNWILITLNTLVHWLYRYSRLENPTPQLKKDTRLVVVTLGAQALLVAFSHVLPKNPAQVVCLTALLTGFLFWYAGGKDDLNERNKEHLAERCALLMVLVFGETLIGFGNEVSTDLDLYAPIMHFLLIVGMFLVYLNEVVNLLDPETMGGGKLYMAASAWFTFCVANVTAGLEMAAHGMRLMGMSGDVYFGLSVAVFLLSFFLFTPFNKYKHPSRKWTVARIGACLLVLLQTSAAAVFTQHALVWLGADVASAASLAPKVSAALLAVAVAAVFAVLVIDRVALKRERKAALLEEA